MDTDTERIRRAHKVWRGIKNGYFDVYPEFSENQELRLKLNVAIYHAINHTYIQGISKSEWKRAARAYMVYYYDFPPLEKETEQ